MSLMSLRQPPVDGAIEMFSSTIFHASFSAAARKFPLDGTPTPKPQSRDSFSVLLSEPRFVEWMLPGGTGVQILTNGKRRGSPGFGADARVTTLTRHRSEHLPQDRAPSASRVCYNHEPQPLELGHCPLRLAHDGANGIRPTPTDNRKESIH